METWEKAAIPATSLHTSFMAPNMMAMGAGEDREKRRRAEEKIAELQWFS